MTRTLAALAALAVLPLALLAGCSGGSSSSGASSGDLAASAMASVSGVNPCRVNEDIYLYKSYSDGKPASVQKLPGCGSFGDTFTFNAAAADPGECLRAARVSDNPDVAEGSPDEAITLNNEYDSHGC